MVVPPPPAASSESGLKLINAGKLTVCSDVPYEPFEFQKDGKIVGFDMDIAAELAKDVKAELNVVDSSFEAIETGTALTGCDVSISSISITDVRKNVMDFSTPYLDDDLTLVATSASGIENLDGAKGKKVGVQQATTGAQYAKDKGIDAQQFEDSGSWSRPQGRHHRRRRRQPVRPRLRHQGRFQPQAR